MALHAIVTLAFAAQRDNLCFLERKRKALENISETIPCPQQLRTVSVTSLFAGFTLVK